MKPMNFPGRLNRRRQEAIDRMLDLPEPRKHIVEKVIAATQARLIEQADAELIKTKINREKQGK